MSYKLRDIEPGKQHRWSGWPGAFCLYCGCGDPIEVALADNHLDPITGEFDTEDRRDRVQNLLVCPADASRRREIDEYMNPTRKPTESKGNTSVDTGKK